MSVEKSDPPSASPQRERTPDDPLIGTRIAGRYRIERVHERGGASIVYAATHEAQQREVAIKMLDEESAADPGAVERFMHEARTASSLSHGHVVGVSDFGQLPSGRPYLVMPMIMGKDLATLISEQGPISPKRVVALLTGVASALDSMHEKGLVHRDIKSENLMYVRGDDGTETALVLDFGIVAGGDSDADDASGTPEFMAPETLSGEEFDHRADVYSLATVAFELLSGGLPFDGNDLPDLLRKKSSQEPRSLSEAGRAIFSPALEAVVARGLARDPNARPSSASKLVEELSAAAALAPSIAPPPPMLQAPAAAGSRTGIRGRRVPRLRTLVGLPFTAQAKSAPKVAAKAPAPKERSGVHRKLPAPNNKPKPEVAQALTPSEPDPIPAPAEELPAPVREPSIVLDPSLIAQPPASIVFPAPQPDSLSPVAGLDFEPALPMSRITLRKLALPALAAACVIAIALLSRTGDKPRTDERAQASSPARVETRAPIAPTVSAKVAEPAAAPPVIEPAVAVAPASDPVLVPAPALAPVPAEAAPVIAKPASEPVALRAETPREPAEETAARTLRRPRARSRTETLASKPAASPALQASAEGSAEARRDRAQSLTQDAVNAMLRGDFGSAQAKFQEATDASPRYAPAFRGKGLLFERMDRPKDAAIAFKQYLRLQPNAPDAAKIKARLQDLR